MRRRRGVLVISTSPVVGRVVLTKLVLGLVVVLDLADRFGVLDQLDLDLVLGPFPRAQAFAGPLGVGPLGHTLGLGIARDGLSHRWTKRGHRSTIGRGERGA